MVPAIGSAFAAEKPAAREATPFPAVSAAVEFVGTATVTEGALAVAPEKAPEPVAAGAVNADAGTASVGSASAEALRTAIVSALSNAGHGSAAELLGAGTWTLDGASLRIEAPGMGKKMISLTVNAAAEKIIRQELQRLGGPGRFLVVPGEGSAGAAAPAMSAPLAGSVQEAALAHPLVERARELFKAEVRSVVDLRQK